MSEGKEPAAAGPACGTASPEDAGWWRGAAIYEVYVRSFLDSDGDGIGDLGGVAQKLDYIADLGVDAVWLSPFYKSPQKDFGYDVSDFHLVDPSAGTMEDFMTVLDGVHARGMKLLLDFVPGHTSDEHPWFLESRESRDNAKSDWYVWADKAPDGGPPSNWLSSFGGSAWQWEPRRGQYYYHPFLPCQPALNLLRPEVLRHVTAQMGYWADLGVDGFRLDAVQCLGHDPDFRSNPPLGQADHRILIGGGRGNPFGDQWHVFDRNAHGTAEVLAHLRDFAERSGCILIGELADVDSSAIARDYANEGRNLHAVYDFDLINCKAETEALNAMLEKRAGLLEDAWLMNVFTNHDSRRSVSNLTRFASLDNRAEAAKMLIFLQMTLRGGCAVFQGEELGLPHPVLTWEDILDPWAKAFWPVFDGRDGARTPFPWSDGPNAGFSTAERTWLPVPPEHLRLNAAAQAEDPDSVLSFFRGFSRWRRGQSILRTGRMEMGRRDRAPLISWSRLAGDTIWRAAVNFSEDQAFFALPESAQAINAPGCASEVTRHGIALDPFGRALVRWPKRA
ncbi:alpha-amylase family glycosyl hydrolase [Mangrovicoccus ximenensis]|uniref:alpha-amylase family glycosyl hydrolase n=1 Tax=Mangrovicoccus ximenensis TaxID=1911570 RepID=UPI000D3825A4|nr:alpha-amylase family glycosyl hydrolase [Mangrovicoccus ximenensis]